MPKFKNGHLLRLTESHFVEVNDSGKYADEPKKEVLIAAIGCFVVLLPF